MIEHDGEEHEDQFAARLERVDQHLAGETSGIEKDTEALAGSSEFDAARRVLGLINRVRSAQFDSRVDDNLKDSVSGVVGKDEITTNLPSQIGAFEIVNQIARGGMGIVFRARDRSLNRDVALKMMLAGPFAYAEERSRFRVEAEAAAVLDHPGIVPVFEVGEHEGLPFFTMGLVEGQCLAARISDEPLKPRAAAEITGQIASAVGYAHRQGVVHRDIKPANILLDSDDRPRITDFGLARRRDTESDLTATQQVLGTPNYMAPEQASGAASGADERADVYSIGATLYCMLTGRPPFQGHSAAETVRQVIDRDPVAPRQLNPGIPIDLNTICMKCLQKDPDRRYHDAESLEGDLRRFLDGNPIDARPIGVLETVWKWSCRRPLVAALACCFLMAVVTLVAGGVWYQTRLNQSLVDLQGSQKEVVHSLYVALTSEAEYLGQMRPIGYGQRIEQLVTKAQSLDTNAKDDGRLTQLLVNSLGHVGAREAMVMDGLGARITAANVWRERKHLVLGLEDGTLVVFDLEYQTKVFEDQVSSGPIARVDVNVAIEDGSKRYVRAVSRGGEGIFHWVSNGPSYQRADGLNHSNLPVDFFGIEVSPDGRHVVGLQSAPPQLCSDDVWHTRSRLESASDPDRRFQSEDELQFSIATIDSMGQYSLRQTDIPVSPRFDLNDDFVVLGRSWLDENEIEDDLEIYDLHSGMLVQSINASVGVLQNVIISRNGRFIACGGYYGVEVFRFGSGERVAKHSELGRCTVESFIGDGGDVLVRTKKETAWLSARYGQPIVEIANDNDGSCVRISSDDRSLVWVGRRQPRTVSLQGEQRTRINAHSLIVETLCFSPDGQLLLSTGRYYGGNETKVWKTETGELAFEFIGSASTFSPDGTQLAAWNGRLQIWDVASGELVAERDCPNAPSRIVFAKSGEILLAIGNFSGHSRAWRLSRAKAEYDPLESTVSRESFSIDLKPIDLHSDVRKPAALSPSGSRVAFATKQGIVVSDIENSDEVRVQTLERPLGPDSMVFLDEDHLLSVDGEASVRNLSNDQVVRTEGRGLESPVLLSSDRKVLICGRQLLRTKGLENIFRLPDWNNAITSASWSPDGRWLAYGLDGGDIALWNLASVQETLQEIGLVCNVISQSPLDKDEAVNSMLSLGERQSNRI
ncbi:MAG: WD40 repeat domain-containing serine/threonine protein kinase, partial [Planctomycetota bacterium]